MSLSLASKRLCSSLTSMKMVSLAAWAPFTLFENCKSMDQLKQMHAQIIETGFASDPAALSLSRIIVFCCAHEFGDMKYARQVFDRIPEPSVFIWNTMIKGYSRTQCAHYGISMYASMQRVGVKPDCYTFPFLLRGFTCDVAFEWGRGFHAHVLKYGFESNVSVHNALVHMYSVCGQVDMARGVFDMVSEKDVATWNAMISGYNKIKKFDESWKLFCEMEKKGVLPTSVTLVSVLSACSKLKDLDAGKQVQNYLKACVVKPNLVLDNALIDMYAACGEMDVALEIFEDMKRRDVISWTTIVKGFCGSGQVDLARNYFDQMPDRDYISWTAMIDGYVRVNRFKEVLELFREMQTWNVRPDEYTMVSILTACAHLGALELGEWIKTYIDESKIKNDTFVRNALIDMYFKCGNVEKAARVFNAMLRRDKFTWTAMIVGLAINGHGKEALDMFSQMLKSAVAPDKITYLGVLCACTHSGMVDEGTNFFSSMSTQHGIEPTVAHYGCMVDLLGRAGRLKEAYEVIQNMPIEPNSVVWGTLLGACRMHKDAELGEVVAKQILDLEPENSAVYVLLCNVYAACNKWESFREVRQTIMDKGIKKTPGCSLIEVNGDVHEFVASDASHPESEKIYSKLDEMIKELKSAGYSPDTSEVWID
ncbi:hypothetical protein ACLB2K_059349 [Fragaria x ananassa]